MCQMRSVDRELGHEPDPELFISHLANVFDEVYRVLKPTGNLFLNIGDTYVHGTAKNDLGKVNHAKDSIPDYKKRGVIFSELMKRKKWVKRKQLLLIPYRLAIELQMRGWIIRDMIIWAKGVSVIGKDGEVTEQFGNGIPESCKDRLTKSYEIIIHTVKSQKYYFNKPKTRAKYGGKRKHISENVKVANIIGDHMSNLVAAYRLNRDREVKKEAYAKNVIQANTEPFPDAHFAVMPTKLVRFLMKMGCPENGTVLDPFMGAGTVAYVAEQLGRSWIGVEINPEYVEIIERRLKRTQKSIFNGQ